MATDSSQMEKAHRICYRSQYHIGILEEGETDLSDFVSIGEEDGQERTATE